MSCISSDTFELYHCRSCSLRAPRVPKHTGNKQYFCWKSHFQLKQVREKSKWVKCLIYSEIYNIPLFYSHFLCAHSIWMQKSLLVKFSIHRNKENFKGLHIKSTLASIILNGERLNFPPVLGARQGGPFSPLLVSYWKF